jgi:hypothetical protein
MSRPGLDHRHRNKDGEISGKHGNALVRTLRNASGVKCGNNPPLLLTECWWPSAE